MASTLIEIRQQIGDCGFAYLPSFNRSLTTIQIAMELGEPIEIPGIPVVQKIIPREKENAPKNIYSGTYGLREFPLHSDLAHWHIPPHYLILRCIVPSSNVFTCLMDFPECLAQVPESTIQRALFLPRRNILGKKHILRIRQEIGERSLLRWDELFLAPANQEGDEMHKYMTSPMSKRSTLELQLLHPADTLIIDNWRMLHGRSSVPTIGLKRIVERTYLEEFKQ